MPIAKPRHPRSNAEPAVNSIPAAEREQRIDEIQTLLALGTPIAQIQTLLGEKWGLTRKSVNLWINRAWERWSVYADRHRRELLGRARHRYEAMLHLAIKQLNQTPMRERVVQLPEVGPDGKPKRRVEVTRQNVVAPGPVKLALDAARRLDQLDGLGTPTDPPDNVAVDVNFPDLWSEDAEPPATGAD